MTENLPGRTYLKGEARAQAAADLKKRYLTGATIHQLAEETAYSPSRVDNLLRHAGTPMRPRGFQPNA